MQYLGVPYVWGGTSPDVGFDCSGLVYYSYGQHGYSLNRVAQSMYYNGVDVDLNDLQAGDILLFGSSVYNIWHAALYIGGGNFIHAPYSGAVVSIQSLSSTAGMRLVAARPHRVTAYPRLSSPSSDAPQKWRDDDPDTAFSPKTSVFGDFCSLGNGAAPESQGSRGLRMHMESLIFVRRSRAGPAPCRECRCRRRAFRAFQSGAARRR